MICPNEQNDYQLQNKKKKKKNLHSTVYAKSKINHIRPIELQWNISSKNSVRERFSIFNYRIGRMLLFKVQQNSFQTQINKFYIDLDIRPPTSNKMRTKIHTYRWFVLFYEYSNSFSFWIFTSEQNDPSFYQFSIASMLIVTMDRSCKIS